MQLADAITWIVTEIATVEGVQSDPRSPGLQKRSMGKEGGLKLGFRNEDSKPIKNRTLNRVSYWDDRRTESPCKAAVITVCHRNKPSWLSQHHIVTGLPNAKWAADVHPQRNSSRSCPPAPSYKGSGPVGSLRQSHFCITYYSRSFSAPDWSPMWTRLGLWQEVLAAQTQFACFFSP